MSEVEIGSDDVAIANWACAILILELRLESVFRHSDTPLSKRIGDIRHGQ
jgi:hypothetical protein